MMVEAVITSSALIIAIILLRAVFKNSVSRRFRYALWALVLLRLLVPVQLFESPASILNAVGNGRVEQMEQTMQDYNLQIFPVGTTTSYNTTEKPVDIPDSATQPKPSAELTREINWFTLSVTQLVKIVWFCGALAVAVWFAVVNGRFSKTLKAQRKKLNFKECKLPVYLVDMENSPCLFGLLRPSIYVTTKAMSDDETLKYVLAHENIHYRHLDHVWAFLRIVCLCVYWFNPLVWVAAWLSRIDCEQACDEAVVRQVGEGSRLEYGRAIVSLISERPSPDMIICTATTMAAGKSSIKKRISAIAANKKTVVSALIVVAALVIFAVACTFTGAQSEAPLIKSLEPVIPSTMPKDADMPEETDAPEQTHDGTEPEIINSDVRDKNKYTFAVFGTDDGNGNTDVVMVATLDIKNYTINFVNIPRDTLVNVSWTPRKANTLYSVMKGGDGACDKLKDILGFDIDFYVTIDLEAFVTFVDAIGGVDFDVPRNMKYSDPAQNLYIDISEGQQTLNGTKALELVRFRSGYATGDIGRIETQHEFLTAAVKQILEKKSSISYTTLASVFINNVDTNLGLNHVIWLAQEVLKLDAENVSFSTLPGNYYDSINGDSYVTIYITEWLEMINDKLSPFTVPITVDNVSIYTRNSSGALYITNGVYAGQQSWATAAARNSSENS